VKITAQQLVDFAGNYRADRILPELVRRLIRATSDKIEDALFPSGESTFRPGADGELQAIGKDPFVPDGASIWELSTELTPHQKGKRDFDKRSASDVKDQYMGKPRLDVTYVAVSMRRWSGEKNTGRQGFIDYARAANVWKDVRIIDADLLEDWLDQTPSVAAWLSREMGVASDDMLSVEHAWEDYSKGCSPPLSTALLLANRRDKAETLTQAGLSPGVTRFKADSPGEAAAFVEAAILSLPEEDPRRSAFLSKSVVISDPLSARFLTDTKNTLVVIALGRASEVANLLAERGHTVFVPYGTSHSSSRGGSLVELPRAHRHEFSTALVGMGMSEEAARNTANGCHCSITVLRRASDQAQSRAPAWATPRELRKLIGPLCCGAWDHESEEDNSVVAKIGDSPAYIDIEHAIQDVLLVDDAPLLRAGKLTALSAPADIWQLSIDLRVINRPLLERFRSAIITVLSEQDPALDLPLDKRAYAEVLGKRRIYSGWLRQGLAEILRLIAVNDDKLGYIPGFSAQHFVDDILNGLPGIATDYRMLASLDSLLPDLAEAAPGPFLAALETMMADDGKNFSPIFEGSADPMFGRTYYLGTLRAMEMLAWDPVYITQVTQLLARMAELDPGGRLTNRPINSLVEIFLPWNPHTNAQEELRHKALKRVCDRFPDIGWALLSKLLPDVQRVSVGTAKPEWREMSASDRPIPTYGSRDRDSDFVFRLARPLAGSSASRWLELVKAAGESRTGPQFLELLDEIDASHAEFASAHQAQQLWEGLRTLVTKHRGFATSNWAMPSAMVDRLQSTVDKLQPVDPIGLHRHLFNNSLIERGSPNETFEERSERTRRERDAAVAEISKSGTKAILQLAREVKTVSLLASSLINVTSPEFCRQVVIETYDKESHVAWLASVLSAQGTSKFGFKWGVELVSLADSRDASSEQLAALLRGWEETGEALDHIASMNPGVQREYWLQRDVFVRSDDTSIVDAVVNELSKHGRNCELITFLGGRLAATRTEVLLDVLSKALEEALSDQEALRHVDSYWLGEIFEELRKRPTIDRTKLMGLEYHWLPALHSYGERQELVLHDHLGESPEFFVEVLSDLYKAEWEVAERSNGESNVEPNAPVDDLGESQEPSGDVDPQRRAKAEIAYKVLDSWQRLPWTFTSGAIDYSAMLAWTKSALDLAKANGRRDVAAREIGKLLAYSPIDEEDQVWPTREVRELIEELADAELESALVIELFNKRGVHSRPVDGGGDQERQLAAQAMEAADALQAEWPRTAQMLRENAKQWLWHAGSEDTRASERRIRL
jgi:hypothetical protein